MTLTMVDSASVAKTCSREFTACTGERSRSTARLLNLKRATVQDYARSTDQRGVSMINVTKAGFIITDRNGEFLLWSECPITALYRFRHTPEADRVTRCSDDAVLAYRRKRAKASRFEEPVAA